MLRWWLRRPWQAFWLTVLAFYVLSFGLILTETVLPQPFGTGFALTVVVLLAASFAWGVRVSWRRSRSGALTKVGIPVLFLIGLTLAATLLRAQVEKRAHHAQATVDVRVIGQAVTDYSTHMGRLPGGLADLTTTARNAKGETRGPFIQQVPRPPSQWTDYRYQALADGTFRITSDGEGRTVAFPEKRE